MVNFGNKLRELRTNAGLTQDDLAKKLNITKSVVSYYELHERTPSPEVLVKLARIFNVTTDYLLDIDHRKLINISDLSDEETELILKMIEIFRKKNNK